ncbi:hypothetical protein T440DRAFT_59400 [Plenodomus tracheiphilus IPT5]|uniref:Uncharacterized protein n=1 Tax=Plenodomus tracheiphilus IPT5 TaxID=1408161 RepID=A0A6A7B9E6_9PLEO|nr:hypothetical protein T440DRAFT_59400 [Plenodomus tracheiphilus IPT5]
MLISSLFPPSKKVLYTPSTIDHHLRHAPPPVPPRHTKHRHIPTANPQTTHPPKPPQRSLETARTDAENELTLCSSNNGQSDLTSAGSTSGCARSGFQGYRQNMREEMVIPLLNTLVAKFTSFGIVMEFVGPHFSWGVWLCKYSIEWGFFLVQNNVDTWISYQKPKSRFISWRFELKIETV